MTAANPVLATIGKCDAVGPCQDNPFPCPLFALSPVDESGERHHI